MLNGPLQGLVIRTCAARRKDLGFIYAADPALERAEIPHAITFKWKSGVFTRGECNYDAHSICVISKPEAGLVDLSGAGYYSANTASGMTTGEILDNSRPSPPKTRFGGFRSVAEIAGKAYAVGLRGMVYRLDSLRTWTRIDDGLPDTFDIQAIHGFDDSDIYAVGRNGDLWHLDGKAWTKRELPTDSNLTAVKCSGDGQVYIGGHGGTLLRGRGDLWAIVDQQQTPDDIWDLEWFLGRLYVSTMRAVYNLAQGELQRIDFGIEPPKTCYQLSLGDGVMWSNGEYDVVSFDGSVWARII